MLAWEAQAQRGAGDINLAIALRQSELEVYRDIERMDPKNITVSQARWVAFAARGFMLVEKGEPSAALSDFEAALAIADTLRRLDPENRRWMQLAARYQLDAGEALLDLGRLDESRRYIDLGMSAGRDMLRRGGINQAVRIQLMAKALMVSAQWNAARKSYGNAQRDLDELSQLIDEILRGTPDEMETLMFKAESEILAGDLEMALGRRDAAMTYWQTALTTTGKVGASSNTRSAVLGALAQRRIGDRRGMTALLDELCRSGYRRGEFKDLCR